MARNKYRLHQFFFYVCIKESVQDFTYAPGRFESHIGFLGHFPGFFHVLDTGKVLAAVLLHRFNHGHPRPGRGQVDFRTFVGNLHGTQYPLCSFRNELFGNVHHGIEITVSLIQFQGGEFRVVFDVHAFVAEDAAQFIYPFHAAYNQALQV